MKKLFIILFVILCSVIVIYGKESVLFGMDTYENNPVWLLCVFWGFVIFISITFFGLLFAFSKEASKGFSRFMIIVFFFLIFFLLKKYLFISIIDCLTTSYLFTAPAFLTTLLEKKEKNLWVEALSGKPVSNEFKKTMEEIEEATKRKT